MKTLLKKFISNEDGAVTVDFVVLTAAILTLGVLVAGYVIAGSETMASNTETELANATVPTVTF